MRRFFLLLVVALGLAPGTWLRSTPPADERQILTFTPLEAPKVDLGPLELAGAWELASPNRNFGSYSALVALGDGALLAASDRGSMLRFAPPGARPAAPRIGYLAGGEHRPKREMDIEAMTRDPASGDIWAAFEVTNRIERYDARLRSVARAWPETMRGWPHNQGAEAMVRLADGRFVVLAEGSGGWVARDMPGLLYPSDPGEGAEPIAFRFVPPEGFRPVDIAQVPDGRVLILLRKVEWGIPPGFAGRLVLADPAEIRSGGPWRGELVADLVVPLPTDNYEGLAVEPSPGGGLVLWLISDDNDAAYQRTLLLKLVWRPGNKARERSRAVR